jgi:hypothetical protein
MLIQYLNTDLEVVAANDLSPLEANFNTNGLLTVCSLEQGDDSLWYGNFEADESYEEPETTIRTMLAVIESLDGPVADIWQSCSKREFNIGYDCGSKPWAFNNGLTTETLRRIAACGGTLRITIYPEHREEDTGAD